MADRFVVNTQDTKFIIFDNAMGKPYHEYNHPPQMYDTEIEAQAAISAIRKKIMD